MDLPLFPLRLKRKFDTTISLYSRVYPCFHYNILLGCGQSEHSPAESLMVAIINSVMIGAGQRLKGEMNSGLGH